MLTLKINLLIQEHLQSLNRAVGYVGLGDDMFHNHKHAFHHRPGRFEVFIFILNNENV